MTEFKYLTDEHFADRAPSPIEIAGAAALPLASFSVQEAQSFVHSVLKARMSIDHPDHGGDVALMKELTDIRSELVDPQLFAEQFRALCADTASFEGAIKSLLNPQGEYFVLSNIRSERAHFAEMLSLPRQLQVDWHTLRNVDLTFLDFNKLLKFHNDYLGGVNVFSDADRPKKAQGEGNTPSRKNELAEATERLIADTMENLGGDDQLSFEYYNRVQDLFEVHLTTAHPELARRELDLAMESGPNRKKSPQKMAEEQVIYDAIHVIWADFHPKFRSQMTPGQYKQFERVAAARMVKAEGEASQREFEIEDETIVERTHSSLPAKFFETAQSKFTRQASIDDDGILHFDSEPERRGRRLIGSKTVHISNFQSLTFIDFQKGMYAEPYVVAFGGLPEISKAIRVERPESGTRAAKLEPVAPGCPRRLTFDWADLAEMPLAIVEIQRNTYQLENLGPLLSIRFRDSER